MADLGKQGLSAIPDELLEGVAGGLNEQIEDWLRGAIYQFKSNYMEKDYLMAYLADCFSEKEWKDEALAYADENWDRIAT